ncbi:MAG TPA: dihydrolipoyl dehydrogenase [Pirellulales bacterium]|jgi:dihydrolipoamide dehydrogenase|nr:dihydrolipoyl dehydrogenase [Pirellulales bacterium]
MASQLVVLGGGPGGYTAAFLAADLGMKVTLVEADPRLGGTCLLRGCIPSKALLHVAKVISEAKELDGWGVRFASPKLEVDALRARKEKVIDTLTGGLKQLAKRRNVEVIQARGVFENSTTLRLERAEKGAKNETLEFEHCILASGSRPMKIPAFDLPTPRVMDSSGALDLPDIPESLLVVGGGYIGLEMGTVYAELGTKVSVVELTDGLLPGADRDLVKPLHVRMEKRFAAIHLRTKVASLADKRDSIEVNFQAADGSGSRSERFSRVLVSVGRRPNSDGLGLENTKVEIDRRGFVVTDDQQRTADPHILAIGDVAGEPMLAHKASHQGKVAVEALHGGPAVFAPQAIPAVVFTDPEIAWAGLTEQAAKAEGREFEAVRYPWAASGRAQSLGRTEGLTKLLVDPETERILGVGIVGSGAGELIAEGVLAIEMGCTARDLAESIHPHPTLSETLSFSGELFLGTATEIYRPRQPAEG